MAIDLIGVEIRIIIAASEIIGISGILIAVITITIMAKTDKISEIIIVADTIIIAEILIITVVVIIIVAIMVEIWVEINSNTLFDW